MVALLVASPFFGIQTLSPIAKIPSGGMPSLLTKVFYGEESAEIKKTIEAFVQATIKFDVESLKKLTHPDFVEISPLGEVDPRAKFLGFYDVPEEKRKSPVTAFEIQDLQTRAIRRDIVIAHYRQVMTIGPAEVGRKFQIQVTTVLSSELGQWVFCSNTFTPIQKKPATGT